MKRKLNLMNLNREDEMVKKEMKTVCSGTSMCFGSGPCACGCRWVPQGGSGTVDNALANDVFHLHSPGYSYDDCNMQIPWE